MPRPDASVLRAVPTRIRDRRVRPRCQGPHTRRHRYVMLKRLLSSCMRDMRGGGFSSSVMLVIPRPPTIRQSRLSVPAGGLEDAPQTAELDRVLDLHALALVLLAEIRGHLLQDGETGRAGVRSGVGGRVDRVLGQTLLRIRGQCVGGRRAGAGSGCSGRRRREAHGQADGAPQQDEHEENKGGEYDLVSSPPVGVFLTVLAEAALLDLQRWPCLQRWLLHRNPLLVASVAAAGRHSDVEEVLGEAVAKSGGMGRCCVLSELGVLRERPDGLAVRPGGM